MDPPAESQPEIVEIPYQPASTVPIEVFPLAELIDRRGGDELTSNQRLQFELVVLCTAGRGRHEVDFETIDLEPGRIVHVRPGQVSRWILTPRYDAQLFLLRPSGRPITAGGTRVIEPGSGRSHDLDELAAMVARTDRSDPLSARSLEAIRELVLALVEPEPAPRHHGDPRFDIYDSFEQLLNAADPPPRTVAACARQLGCSTRTLSRACQAMAGSAPKTLLDEAIALEAQRRLSLSSASVSDVADTLGFNELSNFSRFFQRITGQSPSAFVDSLS